jgi:hypothetical protein
VRYFLDTEFNGYRGDLISMALVREDGREFYGYLPCDNPIEWVRDNVLAVISAGDTDPVRMRDVANFSAWIATFLRDDPAPIIVSDWPDDIRYFCESLITGPGQMIPTAPQVQFVVERIDAYPTTLPGAVQHNALWDARALRHAVGNVSTPEVKP